MSCPCQCSISLLEYFTITSKSTDVLLQLIEKTIVSRCLTLYLRTCPSGLHDISDLLFIHMTMSERFFSFQLSGYESYLAENIAKSARIIYSEKNAALGDDILVVSGDGGKAVVVDRLLLVLLHPYYRELLQHKETSSIILPQISAADLSADFFGVLLNFCRDYVDSPGSLKQEQSYKCEVTESSLDSFRHESNLITCIDFEENEKKQFEERKTNNTNPTEYICIDDDDNREEIKDYQDPPVVDSPDFHPSAENINEHSQNIQCDQCGKSFQNFSSLKQHANIHLEDKPFKCNICEKGFAQAGNLKTHVTRYHDKKRAKIRRGQSTCPNCNKKYNNRSVPYRCECDYILGGKYVHVDERKMLKCPECEYRVGRKNAKSALKKHHDALHANITYSCEFCDYKAGYRQVLKKHVDSIHKGAMYHCKECDYKNKFESGLFQHVQAVHRGVRYMCQFCGHQAIQSSALRKHERAKHKEELEKLGNLKKSRSRFQILTDES